MIPVVIKLVLFLLGTMIIHSYFALSVLNPATNSQSTVVGPMLDSRKMGHGRPSALPTNIPAPTSNEIESRKISGKKYIPSSTTQESLVVAHNAVPSLESQKWSPIPPSAPNRGT
jgi:hypothetical protein